MKNRPGENLSQDISFQFPDSPRSSRRSSLPSLSRISTPTTKIKRCQHIHSIFIIILVINLRQLRIHQNNYNSAVSVNIIIFEFSDFHRHQQGEGHLQVLGGGLDVVPVPLLPGPAGRHPRVSSPPVLPHHHRHYPDQLSHDDPHSIRTDRIHRVSWLGSEKFLNF